MNPSDLLEGPRKLGAEQVRGCRPVVEPPARGDTDVVFCGGNDAESKPQAPPGAGLEVLV